MVPVTDLIVRLRGAPDGTIEHDGVCTCRVLHEGLPSLRARLPLTQQARDRRLHAAAADAAVSQLDAAPSEQQQRQPEPQPKEQKQKQQQGGKGGSSDSGRITPKSEDFGR